MTNGNGEHIKTKIVELLKHQPEGLTIAEISKRLKLHRQTVTKYIYELKGAGTVRVRTVGPATMIYLDYHRGEPG